MTKFKYYARLKPSCNPSYTRLFEIVTYKNGMYYLLMDYVYPMQLDRIIVRQELENI